MVRGKWKAGKEMRKCVKGEEWRRKEKEEIDVLKKIVSLNSGTTRRTNLIED
jgi:hypothetical protein